jgi:gas vesicle protein
MASPAEVEELRERAIKERVDLYRQLKEQLVQEVERYRSEGNDRLAKIISESLRESSTN